MWQTRYTIAIQIWTQGSKLKQVEPKTVYQDGSLIIDGETATLNMAEKVPPSK